METNLLDSEPAEGDLHQLEVLDVLVLQVGLELHFSQRDRAGEENVQQLADGRPSAEMFYLRQLGGDISRLCSHWFFMAS